MSKFTEALEKWWITRIKLAHGKKKLSPVTIRGILYLLRQKIGLKNMPKTKTGFYSALARVERRHHVPRDKLRIITEPKINLITRTEEKPLLKAQPSDFQSACALMYIEKSTIIAAIEEDKSLTDRGINIIKAMGFSTIEVNKVIKQAQNLGVPIFTLTDYDPSGLLIDLKIAESGVKTARIGVDPELVKALGLKLSDVKEALPRAKKKLAHYKYLKRCHPKLAAGFTRIGTKSQPYRVEIDGVFALAGKERFMEEILKRADKIVPIKRVQKALKYKRVPKKVDDLRTSVHALVDNLFSQIAEDSEKPHRDTAKSFNDLRMSQLEGTIEQSINDKAQATPATEVLEATIKNLQKLLAEQKAAQSKASQTRKPTT
jgi:hypothetical protein